MIKQKQIFNLLLVVLIFVSCNNQSEKFKSDVKESDTLKELIKNDTANINSGNNLNKPKCIDIIFEIVKSSPTYKELIKSFPKSGEGRPIIILLSGPNPDADGGEYSEKYEFEVAEDHPDNVVAIGWFEFNQTNGKLYGISANDFTDPDNDLPMVDYDKGLFIKYKEACK